jgi:hypothetical protein
MEGVVQKRNIKRADSLTNRQPPVTPCELLELALLLTSANTNEVTTHIREELDNDIFFA